MRISPDLAVLLWKPPQWPSMASRHGLGRSNLEISPVVEALMDGSLHALAFLAGLTPPTFGPLSTGKAGRCYMEAWTGLHTAHNFVVFELSPGFIAVHSLTEFGHLTVLLNVFPVSSAGLGIDFVLVLLAIPSANLRVILRVSFSPLFRTSPTTGHTFFRFVVFLLGCFAAFRSTFRAENSGIASRYDSCATLVASALSRCTPRGRSLLYGQSLVDIHRSPENH